MNIVEYLEGIKDKSERVIIYINRTDEEQTSNYIGTIKEILDDGSIVLEKSDKYNEIVIMKDTIIAVRKWTEK